MSKVTAYMATFEGREKTLVDAVASIAVQVDTLNVWVNNYPDHKRADLEAMLSVYHNVVLTYSDVFGQDIGDIGKFWFMDEWDGYILTVDDTWIYPADYVSRMLATVDRYNRKAVISVHGRVISKPVVTYYHFKDTELYLYNNVDRDTVANEIGTGVMALHSDVLNGKDFDLSMFKHTNMTDIYFSMALQDAGIPCVIIEHDRGWILQNEKSAGIPRISASCARNEQLQVDVINAFQWRLIPVK